MTKSHDKKAEIDFTNRCEKNMHITECWDESKKTHSLVEIFKIIFYFRISILAFSTNDGDKKTRERKKFQAIHHESLLL